MQQATPPAQSAVTIPWPRKVCVLGLGYVGLPIATLLANRGHQVHGMDINAQVVKRVLDGRASSMEIGLEPLVQRAVSEGRLTASQDLVDADVFLIAVPTPIDSDHAPDLSHVHNAAEVVAPRLRSGAIVLIESTLPIGGTQRVAEQLAELRPDLHAAGRPGFFVACCPERVLPGRIVQELKSVHRVVGGVDEASTAQAVAFYRGVLPGAITGTDARTAELTKLAENTSRDVGVAFANELSLICEDLGVDPWEVIELANRHPRVNILRPGPGVGGHCIAVDPWFLASATERPTPLLRAARAVNQEKERWVIERVKKHAARLKAPVVACLGLTYKADVADIRESPALAITRELTATLDGEVLAVDPHAGVLEGVARTSLEEALRRADIVVLLVQHRSFADIPRTLLTERIVVDTCGALK